MNLFWKFGVVDRDAIRVLLSGEEELRGLENKFLVSHLEFR